MKRASKSLEDEDPGASHPCRHFEASCLDRGLIAAPGPPLAIFPVRGGITRWTLNHGRCAVRTLLHDYSYQEILL
jgi:hypothetical protein